MPTSRHSSVTERFLCIPFCVMGVSKLSSRVGVMGISTTSIVSVVYNLDPRFHARQETSKRSDNVSEFVGAETVSGISSIVCGRVTVTCSSEERGTPGGSERFRRVRQ
jgi:hypothetical protein